MADLHSADENRLWVVECNGAPRSGKGTITSSLVSRVPGAALEETGIDYRAVTFRLLEAGVIDEESDLRSVLKAIDGFSASKVDSLVASRQSVIDSGQQPALYSNAVSSLVGKVGQHPSVRTAVKKAFKDRVRKHIADPNVHILFIDGRDLVKVIKDLPGIETLIRFFIDCQPFVSAIREARRQKIDISDTKNDTWYRAALQNIRDRQSADESRKIDPVSVDGDAINYWYNVAVVYETAERRAKKEAISFAHAVDRTVAHNDFLLDGRYGAGAKAAKEGRQVYFDTTEISKATMLELVQRMVEEALEVRSGTYVEQSNQLFQD